MVVYEISWKRRSKYVDAYLDYNRHYQDPVEARFFLMELLTQAAIDPMYADIDIKKVTSEKLDMDEFLSLGR
jgi:hypothetical protein